MRNDIFACIYIYRVVLYYYIIMLYAPYTLHASQIGANGRGHHTRKLSGWPARGRSAQANVFVKSGSAEAEHVKRHRSNTCRVINTWACYVVLLLYRMMHQTYIYISPRFFHSTTIIIIVPSFKLFRLIRKKWVSYIIMCGDTNHFCFKLIITIQ